MFGVSKNAMSRIIIGKRYTNRTDRVGFHPALVRTAGKVLTLTTTAPSQVFAAASL